MKAIIFDTETTGLLKPSANTLEAQPYITEIFCYKVEHDGSGNIEIIGEFESLLKVPVPLSETITKITGLTDADLADQPTFGEIFDNLALFFTGVDRIVAHNLSFDSSMLANECHRIGKVLKFPWPREHVCTVEKSMHIEQRRMNLTNLHKHFFNEGFPDAHRAKNDVIPLLRVYKEMCKQQMIR